MSEVVHLPDELARRLEAEAARRGVSIEDLAVRTLADRYGTPRAPSTDAPDALEAFIGSGNSGRSEPFDIHQARAELAARRLAEGA